MKAERRKKAYEFTPALMSCGPYAKSCKAGWHFYRHFNCGADNYIP